MRTARTPQVPALCLIPGPGDLPAPAPLYSATTSHLPLAPPRESLFPLCAAPAHAAPVLLIYTAPLSRLWLLDAPGCRFRFCRAVITAPHLCTHIVPTHPGCLWDISPYTCHTIFTGLLSYSWIPLGSCSACSHIVLPLLRSRCTFWEVVTGLHLEYRVHGGCLTADTHSLWITD